MQSRQAVAACPQLATCTLARSISAREALRVWRSFYCDGVFSRCERFKLASGGRDVPDGLLPNGRLLVLNADPAPRSAAGG